MKITKWHLIGLFLGGAMIWGAAQLGMLPFGSVSRQELIEPEDHDSFSVSGSLIKYVVLTGGELVQVHTQALGKLAQILKAPGEQVKGGEPILQFADTIAHYDLQAQYAKNRLDAALLLRKNLLGSQRPQSPNARIQQKEQQIGELEEKLAELVEQGIDADAPQFLAHQLALEKAEKELKADYLDVSSQDRDLHEQLLDINNQITRSKLDYETALMHNAQLTLRAPRDAVLAEISLHTGDEVPIGKLAFQLLLPLDTVEFAASAEEIAQRDLESMLQIKLKEKNLTGSILSLSPSAQPNRFIITVGLSESVDSSGEVVQISLPAKK